LQERTLEEDKQLVYGLFLDEEHKAWGFATRQGAAGGADDWKQLAIVVKADRKPGVQVIDRHVPGQNVFEFSMAVLLEPFLIRLRVLCGLCEKQPTSIHAPCDAELVAPDTQAMGRK
jgi:hypothetical protein